MVQRKRPTRVQIGERNDHGGMPEDNRDAMGHASLMAGHLLVLASGVGGTRGGRVEGNLAVSAVLTHFRTATEASVQARLNASLLRANEVLTSRAARDPALQGTGANCAAVLVQDGVCYATRSGDVRIFVVRGDVAEELLVDQDEERACSDGALSTAQSLGVLGSGGALHQLSTETPLELVAGDRVLVAGPGLHRYVGAADVARIATSAMPQVASGRLVDTARQRGARGGVSVQIVQWGEPNVDGPQALSPMPLRLPESRVTPRPPEPPAAVSARLRTNISPSTVQLSEPHAPRTSTKKASIGAGSAASNARPSHKEMHVTGDFDLDFDGAFAAPRNTDSGPRLDRLLRSGTAELAGQKWALPAAAAMLVGGALWLWAPWSTTDDSLETSSPVEGASAEDGQEPQETAERFVELGLPGEPVNAGKSTSIPAVLAEEGGDVQLYPPLPAALIPTIAAQPGGPAPPALRAGGPGVPNAPMEGFWAEIGRAVAEGEPIAPKDVQGWLATEGDAGANLEDRARARLAELRTVEAALQGLLRPQGALAPEDEAALDRIFQLQPAAAATALKKYIEDGFDARADAIFQTVDAYLTTHRSPEAVLALMELNGTKTGPRTRAWLNTRVPELLAGP